MFVFCIEQFSSYSKRTQCVHSFAIKIQFSFILCFEKIYRKNNMYFFHCFFLYALRTPCQGIWQFTCVCVFIIQMFLLVYARIVYARAYPANRKSKHPAIKNLRAMQQHHRHCAQRRRRPHERIQRAATAPQQQATS